MLDVASRYVVIVEYLPGAHAILIISVVTIMDKDEAGEAWSGPPQPLEEVTEEPLNSSRTIHDKPFCF